MAIQLKFYSFNKRENSTAIPSASPTNVNATLIDDTSVMHPTFKLDFFTKKNYVYVADFNRYYFVDNVRTFQNFWYYECTCDVLASYKSQIGSQSHYVLRAASAYDEYISDAMYPAKVKMGGSQVLSGSVMSFSSNHSYIIGITGYSNDIRTNQTGSVTYYQFNDEALYNFVYYLMHEINEWCHIEAQGYDDPGVQEALINPIQYIVSCIALPIPMQSPANVGAANAWPSANRIDFGYYTYPLNWEGNPVSGASVRCVPRGATVKEGTTVNIPKHPQQATRGKYLNCSPFSDYTFHCGPWGDIPIDPAALVDSTDLYYEILYDVCQGNGRLQISPYGTSSAPFANILYSGYAQVGVPIQLAQAIINPYEASMQYERDYNAAVGSAMSTASSAISLNASGLAEYQTNTVQIIYDATINKYPKVSSSGSNGSMLSFMDIYKCYLSHQYYTVVDENLAELGRPLYQVKQINTLSGYILCQGADTHLAATQEEIVKVNQYLNSGFFYE